MADWQPVDAQERGQHWALTDRVIFLAPESSTVTNEMVVRSIDAARTLLAQHWLNAAAFTLSQRLIMRSVLGSGDRPYADLKEARDLAIRVRDDRRSWRGDSAGAVALACEAALHASDWRTVIRLGTTEGDATADEAADAQVRRHVAIGRAAMGDLGAVPDLRGLPPAQESRIRAILAERTGQDPEPLWRAALAAASDDSQRMSALAGLARTGTHDLPGLEEFMATHPDVAAQVTATAEMARGEYAAAVERLRGPARTSPQAAAILGEAYERLGRHEDAVATLQEAARRFGDPDLAFLAVRVLHRQRRLDEAAAAARQILTSAPDAWPGRTEVLKYAAQAAVDTGDSAGAEELLRTSLDLDPADAPARWGLIRLLLSRADPDAAFRVFKEHPGHLDPANIEQGHAWLALHRREGSAEALAQGAVRLAKQFPDDEQLMAHVTTALVAPGPGRTNEPFDEELLGEVQSVVSTYLERWPNGALRSVQVNLEDPEATLDTIRQLIEVDAETARARRVFHARVARQELPLGSLASVVGRSYTELLLRRVPGTLPAWGADTSENVALIRDADRSLGSAVIADVSALVVLAVLEEQDRRVLMDAFRTIEVIDAALADVRSGRDFLAERSTVTLGWDEATGRGRLIETSTEEADRLARESVELLDLVSGLRRIPAARTADDKDDARDNHLGAWMQTIRTAIAIGQPVWADDAVLRALARGMGAAVFSTASVLEVLASVGKLTPGRWADALHHLARHRVSVPMSTDLLLGVAEEDRWGVGGAAFALGSPAVWANPRQAHALLARILPAVGAKRADQLPDWLYLSATGIGFAHPVPEAAVRQGGTLLAAAIQFSSAQASAMPALLSAVRAGLAEAAPDPGLLPDLLPVTVRLLLGALRAGLPPETADQYVIALFSQVDQEDRAVVLRAVLLP